MTKAIALILLYVCLCSCADTLEQRSVSGPVFGTSYNIVYEASSNYQKQFDSLFQVINQSMSTYIEDSDISKFNNNEQVEIDEHFIKVFEASKIIHRETNGSFDPTIGTIVNAWDFGPEGSVEQLDSLKIDSLMSSVGFNKIKRFGNAIEKVHPDTYLDFNAIAKGYAVDVIAEFLNSQNSSSYLVDIGGEIRTKGINTTSGNPWKIGIDDPNFDGTQSYSKIISLTDKSMATSGTYRKFKVDANGSKYSHIIDTKTGYPSKTNLLSVSVIADDCMTADAYATAFKAMGIEAITDFLKSHPELMVYLIFENEQQELQNLSLNNFPQE
ncbi:FAD:protein FMN transferase [Paucihalobacter sp.]|uniref:FAD:protein FMN transferase n=1 Tax=Paucihalobacter sp. TaxID=2850405 RepID=UPI002FE34435